VEFVLVLRLYKNGGCGILEKVRSDKESCLRQVGVVGWAVFVWEINIGDPRIFFYNKMETQ
jgi:hypothetical protein